jgi:hypothetical protein
MIIVIQITYQLISNTNQGIQIEFSSVTPIDYMHVICIYNRW